MSLNSAAPRASSARASSCSLLAAATAAASLAEPPAASRAPPSAPFASSASSRLRRGPSTIRSPVCWATSAVETIWSSSAVQASDDCVTAWSCLFISSRMRAARSITRRVSWAPRPMFSAAWALCSASLRTSSATTAKPLPCTPVRAASMVALSARRLVWFAISAIASANSSTSAAASLSRLTSAAPSAMVEMREPSWSTARPLASRTPRADSAVARLASCVSAAAVRVAPMLSSSWPRDSATSSTRCEACCACASARDALFAMASAACWIRSLAPASWVT